MIHLLEGDLLLSSAELLAPAPLTEAHEAEVREALSGTLCRCTGYQKIVDAVIAAARRAP